jgi:hypothetical protein
MGGATDATDARWPSVPSGRGHYESWYLRALDPAAPRGVWIRYTVTVPPGGDPSGQLWFTWFDRSAPRTRAVRVDAGPPGSGGAFWIRFGEHSFGPEGALGAVSSDECSARWSLSFAGDAAPLHHLPSPWMYRARLPRTKLLSPLPDAMVEGSLEVDGESISVSGWPGMVGHNWGEQHAEEWIWLSGLAFDGAPPGTWLDVACGRIRIGPVTTPWVANGVLSLDGERFRVGGLGRRPGVTAHEGGCVLRLPGAGVVVTASASAPEAAFAVWDYADPDGSPHRVRNSSVADLSVRVTRPGHDPVALVAPGRAAYEWGRR